MRYAIYFTPKASDPLNRAASSWLGRDAFSDDPVARPPVPGLTGEQMSDLLFDAQRYGFHATLKAPFELAEGQDEASLEEAFETFCEHHSAFDIPNVVIGQLGPFFALVPDRIYPELQDIAASVVRDFEPFRAPLSEADIARRRPERLSESQRDNLMTWGYHHVMEDFRFHMTLTGPVGAELVPTLEEALQRHFKEFVNRTLPVDGLGLFVETQRGEPFVVKTWRPLAAPRK